MSDKSVSAAQSLTRLREGNRRFVDGLKQGRLGASPIMLSKVDEGQQPFAVILGCSDSRVPVEIVFDQGLGDLFVIRNAGNIVAPSVIGSVEYAVQLLNTRLVVVMGHTHCGAVNATIDSHRSGNASLSPNVNSIVERILPAVLELMPDAGHDRESLVHRAVRANVRASANQLRHGSAMLERLAEDRSLMIVGCEYSLETGVVEFFDGVAAAS